MIPLFTKPLEQLTTADLDLLLLEQWPEGQMVEFKQTLAAQKGRTNPWIDGENEIGEHARNDILKEVVAFANSSGGNVLIGVVESADHPKRAVGIEGLQRCHELADRLRLAARDCIEPQLPSLEACGILSAEGASDGVILIRVPPSRLSPHRLKPTLHCYTRRADRTEKMIMREIQDMSVQLARGGEAIQQRFEQRRARYHTIRAPSELAQSGESPTPHEVGFRVTVLPVGANIYIDRVYGHLELQKLREVIKAKTSEGPVDLPLPGRYQLPGLPFRPILRGGKREHAAKTTISVQEVHADGLVEFVAKISDIQRPIMRGSVLACAANALLVADVARLLGGVPGAELILDVELRADSYGPEQHSHPFRLGGWTGDLEYSSWIEESPLRLPLQSIAGQSEFKNVLWQLLNDMLNIANTENESRFEIDLEKLISQP